MDNLERDNVFPVNKKRKSVGESSRIVRNVSFDSFSSNDTSTASQSESYSERSTHYDKIKGTSDSCYNWKDAVHSNKDRYSCSSKKVPSQEKSELVSIKDEHLNKVKLIKPLRQPSFIDNSEFPMSMCKQHPDVSTVNGISMIHIDYSKKFNFGVPKSLTK